MLITIRTNKQLVCMPLEDVKIVLNKDSKDLEVLVYSLKNNENLGSLDRVYGMSQEKFIEYISSHPEQYELINDEDESNKQKQ